MVFVYVWVFFLALLFFCVCALAAFLIDAKQRRVGHVVIGRVVEWRKSGVPGFGRVIIDYTVRGRHYSCASSLIPNWERRDFRSGSMRRYIVHRYVKTEKTDAFYVATAIRSPSR